MYVEFNCNGDRYHKHEKERVQRAVKNGSAPPGLHLDEETRELLAADGRIVGYLRDGEEPTAVAALTGDEATELASLRKWAAERAELDKLRALRSSAAAPQPPAGLPPAVDKP